MNSPLVSAIIPTYNRNNVIHMAIDSVLQQTYPHIELIVLDDGSTDGTMRTLARYGDKIRVLHQGNAGPASARNKCMEVAKGEIITFLDSDDVWLATKVERQVDLLMRAGKSISCCLCNAIVREGDGNERLSFDIAPIKPRYKEGVWTNVTEKLSTRCIFFTQAAAVRRDILHKIGGFDERLRIMEDHELAFRLSLEGPWAYIREPLVIYNRNTKNSLSTGARKDGNQILEAIVHIHTNILSKEQLPNKKIRSQIEHNLRIAARRLRASNARKRNVFGASMYAKLIEIDRYIKGAIYRHWPGYAEIKDYPVNSGNK